MKLGELRKKTRREKKVKHAAGIQPHPTSFNS
jgi:hypothetical protein